MLFYPKTKNLYRRGDDHKLTETYSDERYGLVNKWLITKKMDGMSVILSISPDGDQYFGRTKNTNFNTDQRIFMQQQLEMAGKRLRSHGIESADIYAELVGPDIQSNRHGFTKLRLFVFDVRMNDFWLDWKNADTIAFYAGLDMVTMYGRMDIQEAKAFVHKLKSFDHYNEGVVARTQPYLYDNQGNRLTWKYKVVDL